MTDSKRATILVLIGLLRLICSHGEALLSDSALKAWKNRDDVSISWEMLESGIGRCDSCGSEIENQDTSESTAGEFACEHVFCGSCASKTQSLANSSSCPKCRSPPLKIPSPSSSQATTESASKKRHPPSAKVEALLRNLAKDHSAAKSEPGTPYKR